MKGMLDLGADTGYGLFEGQQQRFLPAVFHFLHRAAPGSSTAPSVRVMFIFTQIFPHAELTRVAVYSLVLLTNQLPRHGDISRCGDHTVGQSGHGIDADMGLHPEEPLIPFPGLLYLRIALLGLVLGGRRSGYNGGVDDGAFTHEQALLSQTGVNLLEDPLGQGMLLQKGAETQ